MPNDTGFVGLGVWFVSPPNLEVLGHRLDIDSSNTKNNNIINVLLRSFNFLKQKKRNMSHGLSCLLTHHYFYCQSNKGKPT